MSPPNQTSAIRSDTRLHLMRLRQERLARKRIQRPPATLEPIVSAKTADETVLPEVNEDAGLEAYEDTGAMASPDIDCTQGISSQTEQEQKVPFGFDEATVPSQGSDLVEEVQPEVEDRSEPEADRHPVGSAEADEHAPEAAIGDPHCVDLDEVPESEPHEDATPPQDADAPAPAVAEEAATMADTDEALPERAPADLEREAALPTAASSTDLTALPGSGPGLIWMLETCGISSMEQLAAVDAKKLKEDMGLVAKIIDIDYWIDFARAEGTAT